MRRYDCITMMGTEKRGNENKGKAHKKHGIRQVPSTPSLDLHLAMIQLGRKIGIECA
jgi:hypothetical protein